MFTPRMALAGLVVLAACSRSGREDKAEVTRAAPNREITGALPPPLMDTDAVKAGVAPKPPKVASKPPEIASKPPAAKHPVTQSHHRSSSPTRSAASPPADTVSVAAENTPPRVDSSAATSMGTAPAPAPAPQAARVVAAGTVIHVSLEDSVNSRLDTFGKQISGKVMDNVTGPNGEVLVRAGTPLRLTVTRLRSGRGSGKGDLEIRPDSITINGRSRTLAGKIGAVPYELKGRGVTGSEAAKVGVGAAGGAVVGGVITGKTKGAVIGGVIGAAGGAAVASQTATKDVVVAARTPVEVVLSAPLVLR
jgi:hypothetical protein